MKSNSLSRSGDVNLRPGLTLDTFGNARFLWAQNTETGGPVTQ